MRDELHDTEIPVWGIVVALGAGIVLPLAVVLPAVLVGSIVPIEVGVMIALASFLCGYPLALYFAARRLGRRWPDMPVWIWVVSLITPFTLLLLAGKGGIAVPGLLFILPAYFGAKVGRRRNPAQPESA